MAKNTWEQPAQNQDDYFSVNARRGREFVVRIPHEADPIKAIENFAKEKEIRFGKVHAAYMGAFKPAKFLVWTPDTAHPENWHHEEVMEIQNLNMLLSCAGQIGIKKNFEGEEVSFVALHFVTGGAWNVPTIGGHLVEGTKVAGVMAFYVTEILGIDVLLPSYDESL
ncbi:MAG: PPC domain-containing DNA-binding protein, partial [Spirochaetaceae bacterium]